MIETIKNVIDSIILVFSPINLPNIVNYDIHKLKLWKILYFNIHG